MTSPRTLLFLLGLVCSAASADGVTLPGFERVVLDNGVVLILNEKHDVPLIGLQAIVRGGAVADPEGKHGLANLLARLLEKGAGDRNSAEFAEAVASVGGELGAAASVEFITVSAEFMAKDSALMVELISDMLLRPTLDADEFQKLRDRSANLIKAAKGSNPGNLMPSYASAFLFGDHPYGNPVGGSETSLANLSHDDVQAYYDDHVGADRLIIAVSGDFNAARMRERLSAAFIAWRPAASALPDIDPPERRIGNRVLLIDKPGASQTHFRIGNVGVSVNFAGRASLDLANTVFGGRFTSMLMTELRTRSGLSYSARSSLSRHSRPGSVFISSFTETSTTVAALDLALDVLGQLRDTGLDEEMVVSARNYIMGQFPPRFETAAQLARQLAMLESYGLGASYVDEYGDDLGAATAGTINAVINEVYPASNNLVFVILGDAAIIRDQLARYGPVTELSISEPRFRP